MKFVVAKISGKKGNVVSNSLGNQVAFLGKDQECEVGNVVICVQNDLKTKKYLDPNLGNVEGNLIDMTAEEIALEEKKAPTYRVVSVFADNAAYAAAMDAENELVTVDELSALKAKLKAQSQRQSLEKEYGEMFKEAVV